MSDYKGQMSSNTVNFTNGPPGTIGSPLMTACTNAQQQTVIFACNNPSQSSPQVLDVFISGPIGADGLASIGNAVPIQTTHATIYAVEPTKDGNYIAVAGTNGLEVYSTTSPYHRVGSDPNVRLSDASNIAWSPTTA
jgi:hypothetical protein